MKEEEPYKFWKEYLEAEPLKKEEKLEPVVQRFLDICSIKTEEQREKIIKMLLQSYFDDLIEFMARE